MPATRRLILIIIILFLLLLFLVVPGVSWSQTPQNLWAEPARELAKKIAAISGPRQTVSLTVRNLSSLTDSEVDAARAAVEAALREAGVRIAPKPASSSELHITLSENLNELLWIAQFLRDDSRDVTMISLSNSSTRQFPKKSMEFALEKTLLWEQKEQILSIAILNAPGRTAQQLLVLAPAKLTFLERVTDRYELRRTLPLPFGFPWPRDLRGAIYADVGDEESEDVMSVVVELPGMGCRAPSSPSAEPAVTCKSRSKNDVEIPEEMLWMLSAGAILADAAAEFSESRNFFTGKLFGENGYRIKVEPFFSAAILPYKEEKKFLTIHAGVDGRVRLYDDAKLLTTKGAWGSELTSVNTGCGGGWQVLATRPGDWTEPDALVAYDMTDGQPVAVTAPLEFPGPVKYLGPEFLPAAELPKAGNDRAIAVSLNLKTRRYEAYTITLTCGR